MADTIRTRSAILLLLADNSSKAISAQDLRDMLVSVWGVFGELFINSGSATQAATQTASVMTLWANAGESNGMTVSTSDNKIVVGTNGDGTYRFNFDISFVGDPGAKYVFQLRKNGNAVSRRAQARSMLLASEDYSMHAAMSGFVTGVATDSFQIYVETDQTTANHKAIDAQFSMERVY